MSSGAEHQAGLTRACQAGGGGRAPRVQPSGVEPGPDARPCLCSRYHICWLDGVGGCESHQPWGAWGLHLGRTCLGLKDAAGTGPRHRTCPGRPAPSCGPWFFHSPVTIHRTRRQWRGRAKSGRGHAVGRWASQVCVLLEELAQGSWGWGRGQGQQEAGGLSQLGVAAEWTCEVGARSSLAVSELSAHLSCSSGAGRLAGRSGRAGMVLGRDREKQG